MGILRKFLIFLDHAAFGLINDIYSIIFDIAAINVDINEFSKITKNLYIIVGIFALFRIAVFLINSMIDPDKLSEKGKGLSSILSRTLIMLVLLIICPLAFKELYTVQNTIMQNNIIPRLIIGQDFYSGNKKKNMNIGKEAGDEMQSIIIEALIPINDDAFKRDYGYQEGIYYQPISDDDTTITCTEECANAINNYSEAQSKGKLTISTVSKYINTTATKTSGDTSEKVYVYNYMIFVTTAAGGFLTYMLFSFALDIAVRVFELIILQVLSPIFIVTYIDPKSSSSGPFKKWLQAIGKSYATLFLRIGLICIMVLLVSWINTSNAMKSLMSGQVFIAKAIIVIGLLIFIKNFPKWFGSMLGIESSGFGGLNIGKKLAGAAMVGGLMEKGLGKAKDGLKSVSKGLGAKGIAAGSNLVALRKARRENNPELSSRKKRKERQQELAQDLMNQRRQAAYDAAIKNGKSKAEANRLADDAYSRYADRASAKAKETVRGEMKDAHLDAKATALQIAAALNAKGTYSAGKDAKGLGGVIKAANQGAKDFRGEKALGETGFEKLGRRISTAKDNLDKIAFGSKTEQLKRAEDEAAELETKRSYVNGSGPISGTPINKLTAYQKAVTGRNGVIAGSLDDQFEMIGMQDMLKIKPSDIVLDNNGKITGYYNNGNFQAVSDKDRAAAREQFDREVTQYGQASMVEYSKKLESNLVTEYGSKADSIKDSQQMFRNAQESITNALKTGIGNAFSGFSFDGSGIKLNGVSIDNIGDKIAELTKNGKTNEADSLKKINDILSMNYDKDGNVLYGGKVYDKAQFENYINTQASPAEKQLLSTNYQSISIAIQSVADMSEASARLSQISGTVDAAKYAVDFTKGKVQRDGNGNPIVMNGTLDQFVNINTSKADKYKKAALDDTKAKEGDKK